VSILIFPNNQLKAGNFLNSLNKPRHDVVLKHHELDHIHPDHHKGNSEHFVFNFETGCLDSFSIVIYSFNEFRGAIVLAEAGPSKIPNYFICLDKELRF
jgi:hypothetical protein